MNSNNLKPDSYIMNQRRIHGLSTNLMDANIIQDFKNGRSRNRELKKKYLQKFMVEIPLLVNEAHEGFIDKYAESRVDAINFCIEHLDGFPGNEIYRIYKSFSKLTTPEGQLRYIIES